MTNVHVCPKTGRACEVSGCNGTLCAQTGLLSLHPHQQGWKCPTCGSGVAPWQPVCPAVENYRAFAVEAGGALLQNLADTEAARQLIIAPMGRSN